MTRRKLAILALSVATGCAIGQALAPQAHADTDTYLAALQDNGVPVTSVTVRLGYSICERMLTDGAAAIPDIIQAGLTSGISGYDVGYLIADAANELCPAAIPAVKTYLASHGQTV